jgi:hypothetical protein
MEFLAVVYAVVIFVGLAALAGGPTSKARADWYRKLEPGPLKTFVEVCVSLSVLAVFLGMVLPIVLSLI